MRELTKSMLSFSWAVPLYGIRQILNLAAPSDVSRPFDQATQGFEGVTNAMREQLGPTAKGVYQAGDQVQRGLVDTMFSLVNPQMWDPNAWMRRGADAMQRSMQGMGAMGQTMGQAMGQTAGPVAGPATGPEMSGSGSGWTGPNAPAWTGPTSAGLSAAQPGLGWNPGPPHP